MHFFSFKTTGTSVAICSGVIATGEVLVVVICDKLLELEWNNNSLQRKHSQSCWE